MDLNVMNFWQIMIAFSRLLEWKLMETLSELHSHCDIPSACH